MRISVHKYQIAMETQPKCISTYLHMTRVEMPPTLFGALARAAVARYAHVVHAHGINISHKSITTSLADHS